MKPEIIEKLKNLFEAAAHFENDTEYWFARELQDLLGYNNWQNFSKVIEKATIACTNSGNSEDDHFMGVSKTIEMPNDAIKEIEDIMLSRYACYLIAQNGDSRKEEIAFAMSYFALQTRKQELLEQRIFERGIDNQGFARIRSKGDKALFGGYTTEQMKYKLAIPKNRPLADFLPTITIKAKDFANEITNFNVQKENLLGEKSIASEHIKNNSGVRDLLNKRGIFPENLPPAEDIKKLERRLESEAKKIPKNNSDLKP